MKIGDRVIIKQDTVNGTQVVHGHITDMWVESTWDDEQGQIGQFVPETFVDVTGMQITSHRIKDAVFFENGEKEVCIECIPVDFVQIVNKE